MEEDGQFHETWLPKVFKVSLRALEHVRYVLQRVIVPALFPVEDWWKIAIICVH